MATSNVPEASAHSFLEWAIGSLRQAGVSSPEQDSWWLLSHLLGIGRGELQAQMLIRDVPLSPALLEDGIALVTRRQNREPLWHLTGTAPFLRMDVAVGPGVFIPRPETERLAERALLEAETLVPGSGTLHVWDACAGSGVLGLTLAQSLPHADVTLIESSPDALPYLAANVKKYGRAQVTVVPLTVQAAAQSTHPHSVDLIVSNPPYLVPGSDLLDPETEGFDPPEALFGGEDGLRVVREVIEAAARVLRVGGVLVMEHGITQHDSIAVLLREAGFGGITHDSDLVGRVRFTTARRS